MGRCQISGSTMKLLILLSFCLGFVACKPDLCWCDPTCTKKYFPPYCKKIFRSGPEPSYLTAPEPSYVPEPEPEPTYNAPELAVLPAPIYNAPELAVLPAPTYKAPEPEPTYTEPEPAPTYVEPEPAPTYTKPEPAPTYTETEPAPTYTKPEPAYKKGTRSRKNLKRKIRNNLKRKIRKNLKRKIRKNRRKLVPSYRAFRSGPIVVTAPKPKKKFFRQFWTSHVNKPRLIGYNPQPGSILIPAGNPVTAAPYDPYIPPDPRLQRRSSWGWGK